MREIIQEYEIAVKVQNIVTDNGLNFVKAMKTYLETFTPEQQTALLPIASASQNASNGSVSTLFQPPIDPEILNLLTENSEEYNTETLKETNDDFFLRYLTYCLFRQQRTLTKTSLRFLLSHHTLGVLPTHSIF